MMWRLLRFVFGSIDNCDGCGIRPVPMFHRCSKVCVPWGGYHAAMEKAHAAMEPYLDDVYEVAFEGTVKRLRVRDLISR